MASVGTALGARAGDLSLLAWPPSEDAVATRGPKLLLGLLATTASTLVATSWMKEESHTPEVLRVRPKAVAMHAKAQEPGVASQGPDVKLAKEEEDKEWREAELERRRPKLLHLSSLAERELARGGSAEEEGKDEVRDRRPQVRFKEMFEACVDVRHLDPLDRDLPRAFSLAASLLSRELGDQSRLTLEGKSTLHKTGEDLADLVARYSVLHAMCRGLAVQGEQRQQLARTLRGLYWACWRGQLVLWRMRIPDVAKALSVAFLAKKYIPVLALSSLFKVMSNSLNALMLLYGADGLEQLRVQGFTRASVMGKVRAMVISCVASRLLQVAGDRLNFSAMSRMAHKLRTEVYGSMLRQDMEWYRLGQQDQRDVNDVFGKIFKLPHLTSNFVNTITRLAETGLNVWALGSLIRQRAKGVLLPWVTAEVVLNVAKTFTTTFGEWLKAAITRTMTKVELNWIEPLMPDNISTVRACAAEGKVLQNWNMFFRSEHEILLTKDLVDQAGKFNFEMIRFMDWAFYIGMSFRLVQAGETSIVADIMPIGSLATELGVTIFTSVWQIMLIKDTIPELARTYDIIFTKPDIGLEGGTVPAYPKATGRLEFRNVSFRYPGTKDVLSDVSFTVPAQKSCAITGSTGAGKSTLLLLMQRLFDPREGQVLLDGVDVRTLSPIWFRRQIAVVSQRPRIFHTSLLKNLNYGCEMEPTEEEVEAACRAACMHDLIFKNPVRFPLGLHTRVSNETLSGGELQRVAIARALLKDSPILLLDEATSALDSESQSHVKEGLMNLMKGRTVITVAHRLETIKEAESILTLESGRIREEGTHGELVQRGGLYSRLYREQIESTISQAAA